MSSDRDERELDSMTKRAQKEAEKLRGQADLPTKAWKAYRHVAACAARLGRVSRSYGEGKATRREFNEAVRAVEKASDHQLAIFWAMDEKQLKEHMESLADFQKLMSKSDLPSI